MARSRRPKPGSKDFNEGIYHRPPLGLSFFKTGVLAAIVILILTYFAYTKELPWSSEGYTATATFSNATTLRPDAPVPVDRERELALRCFDWMAETYPEAVVFHYSSVEKTKAQRSTRVRWESSRTSSS